MCGLSVGVAQAWVQLKPSILEREVKVSPPSLFICEDLFRKQAELCTQVY